MIDEYIKDSKLDHKKDETVDDTVPEEAEFEVDIDESELHEPVKDAYCDC